MKKCVGKTGRQNDNIGYGCGGGGHGDVVCSILKTKDENIFLRRRTKILKFVTRISYVRNDLISLEITKKCG